VRLPLPALAYLPDDSSRAVLVQDEVTRVLPVRIRRTSTPGTGSEVVIRTAELATGRWQVQIGPQGKDNTRPLDQPLDVSGWPRRIMRALRRRAASGGAARSR
jgi:hypothetical protein